MDQTAFHDVFRLAIEPLEAEFGSGMSLLDLRLFLMVANQPSVTVPELARQLSTRPWRMRRQLMRLTVKQHWWQHRLGLLTLAPSVENPRVFCCNLSLKGALVARCVFLRLNYDSMQAIASGNISP